MKLLAILSDNPEKASTKYRFEQYLPLFKKHNINVEISRRSELDALSKEKIESFDIVVNFRCLINLKTAKKIIKSAKRVVFDFDDAIYTRPGKAHSLITSIRIKKRLHYWLNHADAVTVSNSILAMYAEKHSKNVQQIKMALDTNVWNINQSSNTGAITIGWAGSPATIHYLENIEDSLTELVAKIPNLRLLVFSGAKPKLDCTFEYHPYNQKDEVAFIQSLDIGLIPMTYDHFALGKSPIKVIQYMACGIPVVGNIEGGASEILTPEYSFSVTNKSDWINHISALVSDSELRKKMGANGRLYIEKHHSLDCVFKQFLRVMTEN